MTDARDLDSSAELAAYSVMRAVLPSHTRGTEAVRSDIEDILEDLREHFGDGAAAVLIGNLALRALRPLEQRAEQSATTAAAELDAEEQRVLVALDRDQPGEE